MKKYHIYLQIIAFVFACTIMQGCQKEDEQEGRVTLNAVLDDDYAASANGKAHIRGNKVYWDDNDLININGSIYKIKVSGESIRSARIDTVRYSSDGYAAVYPAGQVTGALSAGSPSVTVRIPSILYMTPGQTQNVKGLMVAKMDGDGTSLVFHNAGAVLDLSVKNEFSSGNDLKLYRIVVSSSAHGLSGDGTLTIDGTAPTYSLSSAAGTPLTLDMENDAIAYNATKSYYVPIPSYTEDGGTQFSVTIYATCGDDHYVFSRSSNDGLTVARNKRVPVDVTLDANPSGYTTTTITGNTGLMGSGTEADPYVIATLTDLKYFMNQLCGNNTYSGNYIRQTADIEMRDEYWVDRGLSPTFSGSYDGGGHYLYIKLKPQLNTFGLFHKVSGATIKNLELRGTCENTSQPNGGAFVGQVTGGTVRLENCVNKIPMCGTTNIGGLIGLNSVAGTTLIKCTNKANITASGTTNDTGLGGIIGKSTNAFTTDKCANEGIITASGSSSTGWNGMYIGGICGICTGGNITVKNSYNASTGSLIISGTHQCCIGGLIGRTNTNTYVYNCFNQGAISGTATGVGGIIGYKMNTNAVYIENTYNSGDLSASTGSAGKNSIIYPQSSNSSNVKVVNCYYLSGGPGFGVNTKRNSTFAVDGKLNADTKVAALNNFNSTGTGEAKSYLRDVLQAWVDLNNSYGFCAWTTDDIPTLVWD